MNGKAVPNGSQKAIDEQIGKLYKNIHTLQMVQKQDLRNIALPREYSQNNFQHTKYVGTKIDGLIWCTIGSVVVFTYQQETYTFTFIVFATHTLPNLLSGLKFK